ncbi:MAG: hypothetical protein ABI380_05700 [Edaphobacter sp.]
MGLLFHGDGRFVMPRPTLATMKLVAKMGIRFAATLTLLRE